MCCILVFWIPQSQPCATIKNKQLCAATSIHLTDILNISNQVFWTCYTILNFKNRQNQCNCERIQSVVTYLRKGPSNWEEAPGKDSLSPNLGDRHVWYVPWRHTYEGSVSYVHDFCIIFKLTERSFFKKNNCETQDRSVILRVGWAGADSAPHLALLLAACRRWSEAV